MSHVEITEQIKYIGADDKTLDLFESQYLIPKMCIRDRDKLRIIAV